MFDEVGCEEQENLKRNTSFAIFEQNMDNMKMKLFLALALVLVAAPACFSQDQKENGIKWMSFTEAVSLAQKSPRKIVIDLYTHWCGWCKRMDATTFRDSGIAAYVNAHYYAVKLDAETKDSIRFRGQVFVFNPQYKTNELAVSLLGGNMGYPNFVFLDETFSLITNISGYQTVEQFAPALVYFSEDKYKTQSWEEFQKQNVK